MHPHRPLCNFHVSFYINIRPMYFKFKSSLPFILWGIFASIWMIHPAQAQDKNNLERPKLVVGIVVDQMRWDYLYRYYDRYGTGGFKRMLNEGFSAENTMIDYVPTVTAIGHSTAYTGSVPAIHGIAGNDFIVQATGETMYCAEDHTVETVGSASDAGKMSPKNLLASTMTDELKLATNFRSKVIGVAIKDRGSILPAGHVADAAYWYDGSTGDFISSTYYMESLPKWVQEFNAKKLPEQYLNQNWNTLYPIDTYLQSTDDNTPFEGKYPGTDAPVFPVPTAKILKEKGPGIISSTPYGNTLTTQMAMAAIEHEQMGQDAITDFLAVSFSSTDYVGHQFGPNAIEVEDTYLRLDKDLEDLFNYLDAHVGKGAYTVFLTADHGGAHNATFMQDHRLPSGTFASGKALKALNQTLETQFGSPDLVKSLMNYQVHFNHALIQDKGLDLEQVKKTSIAALKKVSGVAYVVDMERVAEASIPKRIAERIINGYHHERSGSVQIILEPGWYSSNSDRPTGTTHSSWNPYDSHIPLVFMGWGVRQGSTSRITHMTDIAPTIAALLHIQQPNGCIGNSITELIEVEQ